MSLQKLHAHRWKSHVSQAFPFLSVTASRLHRNQREGFPAWPADHLLVKSLIVFLFLLLSTAVYSQTNERVYEELDFRFVTPGARAIAMGKTFVGLADDATAAYSNPAGLSNLLEPEVSSEFNTNQIRHHRFINSNTGETKTFGERVYTPSFFGYAVPRGNLTFSLFRNVVQDYEEKFVFRSREIQSIGRRENGAFGDIDIGNVNYGAGISYLINRYFSVGGSLILSDLHVATHGGTGSIFHPRNGTDTFGSDRAAGGIAGVLIKPHQRISFGAVYNTGSTFHLTTTLFGKYFFGRGNNLDLTGVVKNFEYRVPDRLSFGGSAQLGDSLTVCSDLTWVRYSTRITDKFLILDFINELSPKNYFIRDVYEFHAGAEYRLYRRSITWAARAGVFTDPSHPLRFRPLPGNSDLAVALENFRFNTLPNRTDIGITFGFGAAIANRIQIDAAFSHSRNEEQIVLSFVYKM